MSQQREGQPVPRISFPTRQGHEWVTLTSDELFAGKSVVVFSLPGAFTPTCSSTHLPRYNQLTPVLKRHGVDDVICLSVNDAFVMNQWQAEQKADNIRFLPDGNAEFTAAMGMLVDKQDIGFGQRSRRYSMLVRDGIVEKMFVEADAPGDPFDVSDADTMLNYLAPEAEIPPAVAIFSRDGCSFCAAAKDMLKQAGIDYEELVLNKDFTEATIRAISAKSTVPQVFIDGSLIGGSEDLEKYLARARAA